MVWLRWDNRFGGEERRAGQDRCAITAVLLSQFQNKQVIFRVFLTEFCSLWSRHRLMAHWYAATHRSRGFGACFHTSRSRGCLYRGLFGNFGLSCPCVVRHAKTDIEMIDDDRTPSNPLRESPWHIMVFVSFLWCFVDWKWGQHYFPPYWPSKDSGSWRGWLVLRKVLKLQMVEMFCLEMPGFFLQSTSSLENQLHGKKNAIASTFTFGSSLLQWGAMR